MLDGEAKFALGFCYEHSIAGLTQDMKRAFTWYLASAEHGEARGQNRTGECYEKGQGVGKDLKAAFTWYSKSANQGNSDGQTNTGRCYEYGWGVAKDAKCAFSWYQKSAEQGNARGQTLLGNCYEVGFGVEKDLKAAFSWHSKSAAQGDSRGQNSLGLCYEKGIGVEKDLKSASEWYLKSAEQGQSDAQANVGVCYEKGEGVEKNLETAFGWYLKSAQQGLARGQNNLGLCYEYGKGVEKDLKSAYQWYLKSAEQGNSYGECNLGRCYEDGMGVEVDLKVACSWYEKSAAQGNSDGKANFERCSKLLASSSAPTSPSAKGHRVPDIELPAHLTPISGISDQPLVSLSESLRSLPPSVMKPTVLKMHTQSALHFAHNYRTKNADTTLTNDEVAAVNLYTQESPLYGALNASLREAKRKEITPFFPYLRLIFSALDKLKTEKRKQKQRKKPKAKHPSDENHSQLHRGVKLDLKQHYAKGTKVTWWGFSSCTTSVEVLEKSFLGTTGPRTLFTIETGEGVNVAKFTAFPSEDEVLLLPGSSFEVTGVLSQGELTLVYLKQDEAVFVC